MRGANFVISWQAERHNRLLLTYFTVYIGEYSAHSDDKSATPVGD